MTERDMLIDDLGDLSRRIKDSSTPATALAMLSKRKHDVLDKIKQLDLADDPTSILDESDDEAWDGS